MNKKTLEETIEENELISTTLFFLLWLGLAFLAIVILFTLIVSFFPKHELSVFIELLERIGVAFQGTVGIAVAFAGAVIVIRLASISISISRSSDKSIRDKNKSDANLEYNKTVEKIISPLRNVILGIEELVLLLDGFSKQLKLARRFLPPIYEDYCDDESSIFNTTNAGEVKFNDLIKKLGKYILKRNSDLDALTKYVDQNKELLGIDLYSEITNAIRLRNISYIKILVINNTGGPDSVFNEYDISPILNLQADEDQLKCNLYSEFRNFKNVYLADFDSSVKRIANATEKLSNAMLEALSVGFRSIIENEKMHFNLKTFQDLCELFTSLSIKQRLLVTDIIWNSVFKCGSLDDLSEVPPSEETSDSDRSFFSLGASLENIKGPQMLSVFLYELSRIDKELMAKLISDLYRDEDEIENDNSSVTKTKYGDALIKTCNFTKSFGERIVDFHSLINRNTL